LSDPKKTLTREQVEASLKSQDSLQVIPGLGFYNDALWEAVKSDPILKIHQENGDLTVVTAGLLGDKAKPEEPVKALPDNLDKVTVDGARLLADGCQDPELLQKWLDAEAKGKKRDGVLKGLTAQLAKIEENEKRFKGDKE
jgi:hypothetical protein